MTDTHLHRSRNDNSCSETESPPQFELGRRQFVQVLGAGLVISVTASSATAQQRGRGRRQQESKVAARIHVGQDGTITVMSGKIEMGQGARENSRRRQPRSCAYH